MKSRASAKEEKEKSNNTVSHREYHLKRYSLWFIVFIGIMSFSAGYCSSSAFALDSAEESCFSQGEIKRTILDNGMVVLIKEKHNLPLVNLFLMCLSGSAQEEKLSSYGVSHFIEHMVFKGTAVRKVGDIFKEIESFGGTINAFTGYDCVGYKVTVPSKFASSALEILSDMVMNASFDQQELEKERQVVLKEIKLNYDDPQKRVLRLLWQTAYSVHPYKYPILGQQDLFKQLTRKDLIDYYQTKYVPNNMILAIVGDVEAEDILIYSDELFKNFQRRSIPDTKKGLEPEQKELRRLEEKFTAGMTYLLFGFHSVALTDEDCFPLDVLATILGEGKSSRLYNLICKRRKLAYSIKAINYTPLDPGLLIISSFLKETHRRRVESLIFKQIKAIKKKLVSENELASAKNRIISDVLFQNQTIAAQAQDMTFNEAMTGDFRFTEKYVQKINQVNCEDVLRVANKYLNSNNLSIVALIPRDEPRPFSLRRNTAKQKGRGESTKSEPLKIGIENLTKDQDAGLAVKRYVLDNGLTLLVRENEDLPLVSITAVFKGGLRAEDENSNGICNLIAAMLDQGTTSKDSSEIAYLIESKGARLSYFSGNNSFGLSLDFLSKDFEQILELLSDLIMNSTFPEKEFKRLKEKSLAQLKAQEDDIFESGIRMLKSILFQKHPYRFLTLGNEKSLKKMRRRDLINFCRDFCVGRNLVLAVFGDVDAEEVLVKTEKVFAKLSSGGLLKISPAEEPKIKTIQTSSKSLPKKQSLLLMGFHGTTVYSQNRYALEMICHILSRPSGKLFTEIRQKSGYAYSLGAYSVPGLDPGYIVVYVATTQENVEAVKNEILRQLRLLKEKLLSEEELAQAKMALISKKLISRQTNSACTLESSLDELYELGSNYYLQYTDQINQIEAEDIIKCAKQYFDLTNYTTVVVGAKN